MVVAFRYNSSHQMVGFIGSSSNGIAVISSVVFPAYCLAASHKCIETTHSEMSVPNICSDLRS
jgi:hypothetical protein